MRGNGIQRYFYSAKFCHRIWDSMSNKFSYFLMYRTGGYPSVHKLGNFSLTLLGFLSHCPCNILLCLHHHAVALVFPVIWGCWDKTLNAVHCDWTISLHGKGGNIVYSTSAHTRHIFGLQIKSEIYNSCNIKDRSYLYLEIPSSSFWV